MAMFEPIPVWPYRLGGLTQNGEMRWVTGRWTAWLPGHQVQLFRNLPLKANSRRMGGEDPQLGTPSTPQKLDSRGTKENEEEMTSKVDREM